MKKPIWFHIYLLLSIVSVVLLIYIGNTFYTEYVDSQQEQSRSFNTEWFYTEKDGTVKSLVLPASVSPDVSKGEAASIFHTLPRDLKNGQSICFSTYHASAQVYVDGKLIYRYGVNDRYLFGRSPASTAWHFVDLPDGSAGKTLEIRLCSPYERYSGSFNTVLLGTRSANIETELRKFGPSIFLSGLTFIIGLFLLTAFLIAGRKTKHAASMLYESLFVISISACALSDTFLVQAFFLTPLLLGYVIYFLMLLAPIPYLLFVKEVYAKAHFRLYDILCGITAANFIVCVVLQLINLIDLPQIIYSIHLIAIASLVLSLYTAHESVIRFRIHSAKIFLWGCALMLTLDLVDMVRYYSGTYQDGALFCRIGLLVFIALLTVSSVSDAFSMMKLGAEARVYRNLAFKDILTGLENRTSFERKMEKLNRNGEQDQTTIIIFDLNNLKQVNDCRGHLCGDRLIADAAEIIKDGFGLFGQCYRIGGDEFAVLMRDWGRDQRQLCFDRFFQALEEYKNTHEDPVEVAYGWAKYHPEDCLLTATMNRADEWMYSRKKRMKNAEAE
ncbi:MAG: diguanylate cyclase [Clostridiales bacterium]|nr:diguanylate cyclase [Clostridiales bacterium]